MSSPSDLERRLPQLENYLDATILDPQQWHRALGYAVNIIGASAATLGVRRKGSLELVDPVAATWDEQATAEYLSHFCAQDTAAPRLAAMPMGSSYILDELVEMRSFCRSAFFNDWADKHGVAFLAGIPFEIDERHFAILSFHRSTGGQRFDEVERAFMERIAVPIRFALRHRRLAKEFDTARGILDRLAMGVVHLDERGGIVWCNERAEEILRAGDGLGVAGNRLRAKPDALHKELEALIHKVLDGDTGPRGGELVIRRSFTRAPLHVVAVPVSRRLHASLWGDYVPCTLFLNDLRDEDYLMDLYDMFRRVFNLTKIQAEIACGLVEGSRNKDLVTAERNVESIRTHVKAVYNKTGVNSRTALQKLAQRMVMQLRPRTNRRDR